MLCESHGRSQKKRKRAMEKICRHQDDGEGPTSHKMKGRQRCPKCFCGLEGGQRGIDLWKSSITASFSRCLVPLELLKQSLISLRMRSRRRLWSQLLFPDWCHCQTIILCTWLQNSVCKVWVPWLLNTTTICARSTPAVVLVLDSAIVMWYEKNSFNETAAVGHQLSQKYQTQLFC